jgi:hypothetical protein
MIATLFGTELPEIYSYAETNPKFRANLLGYLAEIQLQQALLKLDGVLRVEKISDSDTSVRGDIRVELYTGQIFHVECKRQVGGEVRLHSTATRPMTTVDSDIVKLTRLLPRGRWEILAIALYDDIMDDWSFKFIPEFAIPESRTEGFLKSHVQIDGLPVTEDFLECTHVINTLTDLT